MTSEPDARSRADSDPDALIEVAGRHRPSLVAEFLGFLSEHKKWWLLPILIAILLLGVLVFLSGTAAAPFIYTLF